jgi:hypothetical protein
VTLTLARVPGRFAVVRLDPAEGWPWWATGSRQLASVTRTPEETSVVCDATLVPPLVRAERDFAAFVVAGPIPFTATGVLARLAEPLAAAGVSLLAIATFDTDYVLVREGDVVRAASAWRRAGVGVTAD